MIVISEFFKTPSYFFSLKLDDQLIGTAEFQHIQDEAQIIDIQIEQNYRRQGYGQVLLQAMLAKARELGCVKALLEVRSKNIAAIQLYQKNGFVQNGFRKKYYGDDDALLMLFLFAVPANH